MKLLPGVRLNIGKSGPSVSIGGRGARVTVGDKGTRTTVGIPGSGLSYSRFNRHAARAEAEDKPRSGAAGFVLVLIAIAATVAIFG